MASVVVIPDVTASLRDVIVVPVVIDVIVVPVVIGAPVVLAAIDGLVVPAVTDVIEAGTEVIAVVAPRAETTRTL